MSMSIWNENANGRDEHAGPLAPTQQVVRREDCPECLKKKSGRCRYCQAAGHGRKRRDYPLSWPESLIR